jgi:methionyl-tRNA formyltransferase
VAAVTQPDRPAGRGHKLIATPVKTAAAARGIDVATPEKLRPFAADVRALAPDLCVVASYGRIIPAELLDAVPLWLNIHPSALPLYRGATPIQSAIRDGRSTTAVTIIAMDAGMDTGDIVAQSDPVAIGPAETYGELHDRLAAIAADLLAATLDRVRAGNLERIPQSRSPIPADEIAATLTRPIVKEDGHLERLAEHYAAPELVNFVRALNPAPCAFAGNAGTGTFKVLRAHASPASPLVTDADVAPGTLVAVAGHFFLHAADGAWLVIDEIVPTGGRAMGMTAFANGHAAVSGPLELVPRFRPLGGELLPR